MPERIEGRAAWYSLAFSLRMAAAVLLDIEPGELDGGMYVTRQDGVAQAQAFLSDRLENGAGYATYLSKADTFTSLVDTCGGVCGSSGRPMRPTAIPAVPSACGITPTFPFTRCSTGASHSTWSGCSVPRMSRDLPFQGSYWEQLVGSPESAIQNSLEQLQFKRLQEDTPLPIFLGTGRQAGKSLVITHPLWTEHHADVLHAVNVASPLSEGPPVITNPFMLIRRPSEAL